MGPIRNRNSTSQSSKIEQLDPRTIIDDGIRDQHDAKTSDAIDELAKHAIDSPLMVRRDAKGKNYIADGRLRRYAAIRRGQKTVPVIVQDGDQRIGVIEFLKINGGVRPLYVSGAEKARAVLLLKELKVPQSVVVKQTGIPKQTVSRWWKGEALPRGTLPGQVPDGTTKDDPTLWFNPKTGEYERWYKRWTDEVYTPIWLLAMVKAFFGGHIDTDPASHAEANDDGKVGQIADRYYSLANGDDGLRDPWIGRCWNNMPFSDILPWIKKGLAEYAAGRATEIIFFGLASLDAAWFHEVLSLKLPVLFFKVKLDHDWRRPNVYKVESKERLARCTTAEQRKICADNDNPCGMNMRYSVMVYVGPRAAEFAQHFASVGSTVNVPAVPVVQIVPEPVTSVICAPAVAATNESDRAGHPDTVAAQQRPTLVAGSVTGANDDNEVVTPKRKGA